MKKIHTLAFLLLTISLLQTSCTREAYVQRIEYRIEGSWSFSTVRFLDFLVIDNVSDRYENAEITFKDDYSVIYITNEGDELVGTWTYNIVDGGDDSIGQVVMQLTDSQSGEDFLFLWDGFSVTQRRMRAIEDYDGGQLSYVLRRL